jgi:hypothetical protein
MNSAFFFLLSELHHSHTPNVSWAHLQPHYAFPLFYRPVSDDHYLFYSEIIAARFQPIVIEQEPGTNQRKTTARAGVKRY